MALLVQPSSAVAERVFSILSNCFKDPQTHSSEDYIEASVMLQYNSREYKCVQSTLVYVLCTVHVFSNVENYVIAREFENSILGGKLEHYGYIS